MQNEKNARHLVQRRRHLLRKLDLLHHCIFRGSCGVALANQVLIARVVQVDRQQTLAVSVPD